MIKKTVAALAVPTFTFFNIFRVLSKFNYVSDESCDDFYMKIMFDK